MFMRAVATAILAIAVGACNLVGDVDGWEFAGTGGSTVTTTATGGTGGTGAGGSSVTTGGSGGCVATSDDAFDQFSATDNPTPNARWRYGFTDTLGGTFTVYDEPITSMALDAWRITGMTDPNVVKNPTGSLITHSSAPIDYPADDYLHIHPGPSDEHSLARWTAPQSGRYRIDANFNSLNTSGATTGVHVVHEGVSIFDGVIDAPSKTESFSQELDVDLDATVDFVVDDGGNGHGSDSTGVEATLTLLCP